MRSACEHRTDESAGLYQAWACSQCRSLFCAICTGAVDRCPACGSPDLEILSLSDAALD
jgi:rRNA maturation endonuclease Nob1